MIDYSNKTQFEAIFQVSDKTREDHRKLMKTDPEYVEAFTGLIEMAKARQAKLSDTPVTPHQVKSDVAGGSVTDG